MPVAMIEPSFRATLVAAVGTASLPAPGFQAARIAAVTLSAVAVPADPEHCMASKGRTNPLTKNHLAMTIHVRPEAGLDNGDRSWQVKTSLLCGYLLKVARLSVRAALTVRAPMRSRLRRRTLSVAVLMIGRMTAPAAQMMLSRFAIPAKVQKTTISDDR